MGKLYLLFSLIFLSSMHVVCGQQVEVKASLDSTNILIGSQLKVTLEVSKPKGVAVAFPFLKDTITKSVEVLDISGTDSILLEEGQVRLSRLLTVTSFDSGYHVMPPFPFYVQQKGSNQIDTITTNSLAFTVHLVAVDTSQTIKPIKELEQFPFTFREALPYILLGLLVLAIGFGVYLYFKRRQKPEQEVIFSKPKEPAHRIALRALDELKAERLWQAGEIKNYHARITDILRVYLEQRFQIDAIEQTSSEILITIQQNDLKSRMPFEALKNIFLRSDMVKFAKGQPSLDENLGSLDMAYDFVKQTIKAEPEN